jgi:hypothetical protein
MIKKIERLKNHDLLRMIAKLFNDNGIKWGLGASACLKINGMNVDVNDFDLIIHPNSFDNAFRLLIELGSKSLEDKNIGVYNTGKFEKILLNGIEIDMISEFRILNDGVEFEYKPDFEKFECIEEVYLTPIWDWVELYRLMGRLEKSEKVREFLEVNNVGRV